MTPTAAARDSLEGLALGDAFGERWFPRFWPGQDPYELIRARRTPEDPAWRWTDDTAMALALHQVLVLHDAVHQDQLAEAFAAAYLDDRYRGYGYGMHQLLPKLAQDPSSWRTETRDLFDGQGSLGNGAAMRVAPLGAWFCEDLDEVAEQAVFSAEVTHAHPEGVAGAVAVALAAALAARSRNRPAPHGAAFLTEVADRTPSGRIRDGLRAAAALAPGTGAREAAEVLGNGRRIRASDTVPFALWSAAWNLDSLADALWTTAEGLGDVDTTCAITGGAVAARTGTSAVPALWRERREPLPDWLVNA
ncbi:MULTISPECIES: ADP-ribosylglycohydrolase family protein [unclassified Streptomyces]|uniref:ADP-ribosylglycohydrolase family protein n=1 Tax=unclassified Streptomyces TaxID=2593676 RepID=UPI0022501E01|nr:ADP-ribosylglycohydrolase family protein [Streptomyces sp. NBC_01551]MCX4524625.1 ADP-ribosylglycohydrolase family protein [Streptomyces sp. NBC_01551]